METSQLGNPRIGNTGVQNTQVVENTDYTLELLKDYSEKGILKSLVDWCQFTIPIHHSFDSVFTILGIPKEGNFTKLDDGRKMLGYSEIYINGKIFVMTGGTAQMGHHIVMSGQACREYELYCGLRWKELFASILEHGGKFSRLDVAIDDFHGYFEIPALVDKIKAGELSSKFKRCKRIEDIYIADGSVKGNTLYYGSSSSDLQIRMYEKNHEQDMAEEISIWNRTELQMRNERAIFFASAYVRDEKTVGEYAQGVLKNYLTFKDASETDSNPSRWPVSDFWERFLGAVEKLRLTTKKPDRSIERIERWMYHQTSKAMAIMSIVKPEEIQKMIMEGSKKIDEKDDLLIWNYIETQKKLNNSIEDKREQKKKSLLETRRLHQNI